MGVVGLETSFAACYTSLVKPGVLPLGKLMDLMHDAPMRRFGCGTELAIGQPADLTVFNLSESYVVEPEQFCRWVGQRRLQASRSPAYAR